MRFLKSVLFSRLVSLLTYNISARWIRLVCLVSLFAIALSSLPVRLKHDSATAQGSRPQRTQGPPSRNLPNLNEARGIEPGTPKIMPPVPATKCRGRDEKCKKAKGKGKISNNLPDNQDRLQAYAGHQSRRDYIDWFSAGTSPLSVLADLFYWPASIISNFPDLPYRDGGSVLAESAVKGANPRNETYGNAASGGPRKAYGYRSGRSPVTAQSGGVVSVTPGAYQTPYLIGDVTSPSNTGHGYTSVYAGAGGLAFGSCRWFNFPSVSGQITSIKLKFDWAYNNAYAPTGNDSNSFRIYYSLNGDGGTDGPWVEALNLGNVTGSNSGSVEVTLPTNQDLSLVQVYDSINAGSIFGGGAGINASVSNIRLEVDTVPVISNVAAGGITSSSATITWTTNELADSQVEYGTTGYTQSTALNPALVTAHSQGLSGLTAGTLYHYRVKSKDATGNLVVSSDFTFTTAPLVISNVAAGGITSSGAIITWTTNYNSDSQVEYGPTTTYGQSTTLNPALVTAHSQGLSGLTSVTLYHYRVKSRDAAGNLAVSGDFTFTTAPDTTPPIVTSFSPAAGAAYVNANANVTVTFSEAMNPATVNGSTVELRDPSNALVPATVSYNAASFTATLDPTASLSAGATYTARVRGGGAEPRVKDLAGNALAADVTWTFTTWPANLDMALIDPINRIGLSGEDLLSRNCNWSLPLLSLPGRAGLDLGLALSLNSLVYTRAGSVIHFDPDQGDLGPGFRLGFPEIRNAFINTDAGAQSYLLSMPSGQRVEFRQTNTNVYEAVDSSYMLLTHDPVNSVFVLYTTDGTQCRFVDVTGLGDYKCVQIKDRNGNYITIGYGSLAEIRTVTDTPGRVINFNYDGFSHLNSITQDWGGQTHTWATFAYGTQTVQTNFPGLTLNGTTNGAQESVLLRVGLADGSVYSFEYNTYCQVKTIRRYAPSNSNPVNFPGDYLQLAYTTYGLPDNANDPQTDCPRLTSRTDWAYDWNPGVTSTYAADPGHAWSQVTSPDGTIYKEFFATTGWQRGLTTQTENWSGGVKKKWTTLQWTQDNTGVSYRLNPRVTETIVYDDANNRRRTVTGYTSFGLPSDVSEYDADTTTVLRRMHTDYNLSAVYTDRRIIGLPSARYLYDGNNTLFSKVTYVYDLNPIPNPYLQHPGPTAQHDTANYGPTFVQGRGNLNVVRRWDVTDQDNQSQASEYETGYNTSGSVIFTSDPLHHRTDVSYDDSFSDEQNDRNTYAYPTKMTDPDTFSSFVQYNYDFGTVTRTQDPKLAVVTRTYDAAGRVERVRNEVNGAYTRYIYAPNQLYIQSYTTVNDLSSEFYRIAVFDGHGRTRGEASAHPGSVGGYKAQNYEYDIMGRLFRQTNPTEINVNGAPAGDDVAGWVWSFQSYDWQGRPTVTTNQDGTTREISYSGCGCAGGSVTTIKDEGTVIIVDGQPQTKRRQQKVFHDILGREVKTQALNWEGGTPYSTTVTTYNARDQITSVKEYSGDATGAEACPSGACKKTEMTYDGHGRPWKQRSPIETADNVYIYNPDDTLWKKTDPRGITCVHSYNNRGLVTEISYDALPNAVLPPNLPSRPIPSSRVTFGYDEAGNRIWMDDAPGRVDYTYDQLSRLKVETRLFDVGGFTRSFTLRYEYNLAGQLKQITDPWNATVTYNRNTAGQEISVTGVGYKDYTTYTNWDVDVFANDIKYRAWGGIKQFTNGSRSGNTAFEMGYDARLRLTRYTGNGRTTEHDYYNDGLIKEVRDLYHGSTFLRIYEYDHVRRLTKAHAGGEAQTISSPYSLTYGYDAWGHSTSRQGSWWDEALPNFSTAYVNDRDTNMTYDAAGNAKGYSGGITDPYLHYNAAGQLFAELEYGSATNSPSIRENYYDGNGAKVSYVPFNGSLQNGTYSQRSITYLRPGHKYVIAMLHAI